MRLQEDSSSCCPEKAGEAQLERLRQEMAEAKEQCAREAKAHEGSRLQLREVQVAAQVEQNLLVETRAKLDAVQAAASHLMQPVAHSTCRPPRHTSCSL